MHGHVEAKVEHLRVGFHGSGFEKLQVELVSELAELLAGELLANDFLHAGLFFCRLLVELADTAGANFFKDQLAKCGITLAVNKSFPIVDPNGPADAQTLMAQMKQNGVTTVILVTQPEKAPHTGKGFNPGQTTVSLVRFCSDAVSAASVLPSAKTPNSSMMLLKYTRSLSRSPSRMSNGTGLAAVKAMLSTNDGCVGAKRGGLWGNIWSRLTNL